VTDSPKPTVVVSEPLNESSLKFLSEHARVIRTQVDRLHEVIEQADALVVRTYTQVDADLLSRAPRLKVVGRAGVAYENIDVPACRSRGIAVVHTPAASTEAVVDYTIAHIILMNRRFYTLDGYVEPERFHEIRKQSFGRFLAGLTLGIVGAGRIGSRVGKAAVGLGMNVLYNDIRHIELDYPARSVEKDELYASSDIVTIHVPLTSKTKHMINADSLGRFKQGAQFINAARGPCVDYHALAEALRSGRLSAATIDCHDPEPPPPDYPLWNAPNVILNPHSAARVPQAMENMCLVVHDVVAVLQGKTPRYPVQEEQ